MKTIILSLFLLLTAGAAVAQKELILEPRIGFGTFLMGPMKEFQQLIVKGSDLEPQAVDSFGPYLQYGLNTLSIMGEDLRVGSFYEFGSTGGRVSYKDYSGEYQVDKILSYHAIGFKLEKLKPVGESRFRTVSGVEANFFRSNLKINEHIRVFDAQDSNSSNFFSLGGGLKPYGGLHCQLFNLHTVLSAGYLVNISGPFRVPGQKGAYLNKNSNGDKLKPDWSGLRLNFSVGIPIRF